jgi:glyoxylase-like metal-dependent hydrolase (beta-lactamase superfamily II)
MFVPFKRDTVEDEADSLDNVFGFYRFDLGEYEIIVINDGIFGLLLPVLAANAPEEEVLALMQANALGTEFAPLPNGIVLVRTGDRVVLLDTGLGSSDFARDLFGDYIGGLLPTLELIGIAPETITDVIFSHSHLDHLAGTSSDGRLLFPNAQHYLPQLEWEDLQGENFPEFARPFVEFARNQLQPLLANDGQLAFYGDEEELVPGILAIAAPGHSAGHHALLIESAGQQLLLPFDVLGHPILHLLHPEWAMSVDQTPDLAVETRQRLLARAAGEKIPIHAFHFPFPGVGNVVRDGDAYRYIPVS